jgi:hypothetical protein
MLTAHYQLQQKNSYVNICFIKNVPYIGRGIGMGRYIQFADKEYTDNDNPHTLSACLSYVYLSDSWVNIFIVTQHD